MVEHGADEAVVLHHDFEALFERCFVVSGGHAFFQIVDEGEVGVV